MTALRQLFCCTILVVLAATACGGSSSGDVRASGSDSGSDASTAVPTAPNTAEATAGDGEAKTLDDYLGGAQNLRAGGGGAGGGGNFDDEQRLEEQRLVQQEIQICMRAQGFDYVPEEVGDGLRFFLASERSTLSAFEYAETKGFGISTAFDAVFEDDYDVSETISPNDEHLETLSEGEADAWQLALRGQPPVRNDAGQLVDPETGEPVQGRGAAGGCTLDAQVEVRGDFTAFEELSDEFAELDERIAADPRIAEIARAWVDCMGEQGFDYQDESEARQEIRQEFRPLIRSFLQSGDVGSGNGDGAGQGRGGNRLEAIAGLQLSAEQEAELEALQDRERTVAVASVTCEGDTPEEVEEITARYEAEFVESNRATLEALTS